MTVGRFLDDIHRVLPALREGRDREYKLTYVYRTNSGRARLRDFYAAQLHRETAVTPEQDRFVREFLRSIIGVDPGPLRQPAMSFDPRSIQALEFTFHYLTVKNLAAAHCQ